MYIYLPPITQAVDPDMGGGMSPLVSTCFLKTQLFNDKWLALSVNGFHFYLVSAVPLHVARYSTSVQVSQTRTH